MNLQFWFLVASATQMYNHKEVENIDELWDMDAYVHVCVQAILSFMCCKQVVILKPR